MITDSRLHRFVAAHQQWVDVLKSLKLRLVYLGNGVTKTQRQVGVNPAVTVGYAIRQLSSALA